MSATPSTSAAPLSLTAAERRSNRLERAVRGDPAAFRVLTGDRPKICPQTGVRI
jgi:hypothetical protein